MFIALRNPKVWKQFKSTLDTFFIAYSNKGKLLLIFSYMYRNIAIKQ